MKPPFAESPQAVDAITSRFLSNREDGSPRGAKTSPHRGDSLTQCIRCFRIRDFPHLRTRRTRLLVGIFLCATAARLTLKDAIAKADTLIEALAWIRRFREKITVIKLGGSFMDDADALRHVLLDIVFLESVGMRPVVVHGGGKAINRAMDEAGIQPKFVQGRRVTDEPTLAIVERVLAEETNENLAGLIEKYGGRAMNLNFRTTNVLFGEKLALRDDQGAAIDLGYVGTVTRVDRTVIENLCYAGQVPVIPSMCIDEKGQKYNVNADTAATAVAQALGAEKLVFMSDVNGVRRDKNDPDSLIATLTTTEARQLIATGAIEAGMIPKVEACLEILDRGVRQIHIIDGRLRHSLLLEIYTTTGVGTQIVRDEIRL